MQLGGQGSRRVDHDEVAFVELAGELGEGRVLEGAGAAAVATIIRTASRGHAPGLGRAGRPRAPAGGRSRGAPARGRTAMGVRVGVIVAPPVGARSAGPDPPARPVAVDEVEQDAAPRSSGSGRSEMSSPGKASWCISGPHVAGVDGPHPDVGLLDGQGGAQMVEGRLGRSVAAPCLVVLDRGVGGDVQDPGIRRAAQEREAAWMRASGAMCVHLEDPARASSSGSRRSGAAGCAPRVLALFTTQVEPAERLAAATRAGRCPGSVTSPATGRAAGARPLPNPAEGLVRAPRPRGRRARATTPARRDRRPAPCPSPGMLLSRSPRSSLPTFRSLILTD